MTRWHRWGLAVAALTPGVACAQTSTEEIVHSVWIATCAGLVLMMQPGFALLESGFCRAKNAVNVIMKNFTDCAIASLAYWAVGIRADVRPELERHGRHQRLLSRRRRRLAGECALPDLLRRHRRDHHQRRGRRAHPLHAVSGRHRDHGLRDLPDLRRMGLGRHRRQSGLAARDGLSRYRRRFGRARDRRLHRAGRAGGAGAAARTLLAHRRGPRNSRPQPAAGGARRVPALGGLAGLQRRRRRSGFQGSRRDRAQHPSRCGRRHRRLDADARHPSPPTADVGRAQRCARRSGRGHRRCEIHGSRASPSSPA